MLFLALLSLSTASADELMGDAIIVHAEHSLVEARAALDQDLRDMGYLRGLDLGKRTFYIKLRYWEPRVTVHDSGYVRANAWLFTPTLISGHSDPSIDRGVEAHGLWDSPRKIQRTEQRVIEKLTPELVDWRDAQAAYGLAVRLWEMNLELEGLWASGPPADGAALLLTRWLKTADNDAGEEARELIERFALGQRVTFAPEQVAAANAARAFSRPLRPEALGEPWYGD